MVAPSATVLAFPWKKTTTRVSGARAGAIQNRGAAPRASSPSAGAKPAPAIAAGSGRSVGGRKMKLRCRATRKPTAAA